MSRQCINVEDNSLVDDEYFKKYPVMIHANPNGTGATALLQYGNYPVLPCMEEDDLTGIVIRDRYTEVDLYQDGNFSGKKLTLKGPLSISHMGEQDSTEDWEDDTKSIKVRNLPMSTQQKYKCCNAGGNAGECSEYHNNRSKCDDFMLREYCPNNRRDPICACINFYTRDPTFGVNPKCVDSTCASRGYMTQNLENNPCPTIINCTMQNRMANSGIQIAPIVQMEQNCGANANSILDNQSSGTSKLTGLIKDNWVWIVVGFLVLIVIIIIIAVIGSSGKKEEYSDYYSQYYY